MESHKIPWFQTTKKITIAKLQGSIYCYPMTPPMTSGWSQQSSGHIWSQGRSENDAFPMPKTLVNIWLITGSYPFWFWGSDDRFNRFLKSPSPQFSHARSPALAAFLAFHKDGNGLDIGNSIHVPSMRAKKKKAKAPYFIIAHSCIDHYNFYWWWRDQPGILICNHFLIMAHMETNTFGMLL